MQDDDDPKTPVPAPAGAPADADKDADTDKPEGEKPSDDDTAEAKPTDDDDIGEDDEQDDEDEEPDDEDEDDGDKPKRKTSRALRYKRQAQALKAQLEAERSRSGGSLPQDQDAWRRAFNLRVAQEVGDPPDANDPKYRDNYVRFERETQAYETDKRAVEREVKRELQQSIVREQARHAERVAEHKERVARFRSRTPNFDTVMAKATVPVHPHVEREILESRRSDRIMWVLALDQKKLVKLNNMSPETVAREIGRIEGRLSLPQPKQQTQARKPVTPLRGGGASPSSELSAVNAYIKKQYGDRA